MEKLAQHFEIKQVNTYVYGRSAKFDFRVFSAHANSKIESCAWWVHQNLRKAHEARFAKEKGPLTK